METANQIKASKTEQIPTLPGEVIEEILSRLPVKSLLRFRCVSKSWRSLIASDCFINAHLENSRKNPTFVHHGIILSSYSPHPRIKKSFLLWNPSTRVSKKLPFVDDKLKHGYITKYGFGFDESSGDYKVYGILSVFWSTGRYEATGNVYSLKNNSWNRIEDKDGDTFGEAGKFVSGKLYWGRKFGSNSEWDIVSFDLKSEVYGTVEQPTNLDVGYHPSLGELGGCLCMLCDYRKFWLDIWVLKQYAVKESWNKVVTIPYCDPWEGRFSFVYCMAGNGEILLSYASKFIIYSLKDKQFRYPQMVNHDRFREADVYIESLVSPSPGGERTREVNT